MQPTAAFISHSSNDAERATQLVSVLEGRGVKCWIAPRDINSGSDYGAEIIRGIRDASTLVLLFSQFANASKHCLREVEAALKYDKIIVPIRFDTATPEGGMEYRLSTVQWIDCATGAFDDSALQRVIAVVGAAQIRDTPTTTPEYVILNRCVRCGAQYPEHDPSGCSYHPGEPESIGTTGPSRDYAELWRFACCGQKYVGTFDDTRGSVSDAPPPSSPGCVHGRHIPKFTFENRPR